jgi:tetratricopeptide (TPR) repeat protein
MEYASTNGDRAMHERAASALRECLAPGDSRTEAALHQAESKMAYAGGRLGEAYASAEAALAASRAAGDDAGTTRALCSLAQVEAYRGHLTHADALFDEAARVAARAADPVLEYLALASGWNIAYQRRDLQRCLALCSRALTVAATVGDRQAEAQSHGRLGITLGLIGGRWRESREHFAEARRLYNESGNLAGSGGTLINQAVVEFRLGAFDRALAATEEAIELFDRANDLRGRITGLSNLALERGWIGDIAGAREAGEAALELARRLEFKLAEPSTLENLAAAEGVAGNYERAIDLAQTSLEMRSSSGTQVWSGRTIADLAIWHAALGNRDAARDAVNRLLENEDAIVNGSDWPWYCYWAAAQIFHLDGDDARASKMLLRARRLMDEMANGLEPEDRERFLAIRWNVDLSNAAAEGAWPTPPR